MAEYTDTDEELAMANARISDLEAALAESRGEVERLREGLVRLVHGDYDSGWSAEGYADALLDMGVLDDPEWTIEDPRRRTFGGSP